MPDWARSMIEEWNWREILVTGLIVLGAWVAARLFSILVDRFGKRLARRTASSLDDYVLNAIRWPVSLLIFLFSVYVALHRFAFALLSFLDGVIFVISVFLIVYTLIRVSVAVLGWYSEKVVKLREGEALARELLPLADKVAKLIFTAMGLIMILDHFRIDIKSILVTLGVGTLAIGLALQDTLANMLGGFTIMLDRPFRVGDRIQLSTGENGDVQEIGIRSTRVLTVDGNMLIIPNSILVKLMMTNHSFPDARARVMIDMGVAYGSDTELAKRLMVEAAEAHPEVLRSPEPVAVFRGFGESALNLSLFCYTADFRRRMLVTDALYTATVAKFAGAHIEIPYPIRTVRLRERS